MAVFSFKVYSAVSICKH